MLVYIAGLEYQFGMNKDENKHTAQIEKRKSRLDWNKWDAVFFVILATCVILLAFVILNPMGNFSYLCGRFCPHLDFFIISTLVLIYPVIGILISSFVVIGTVRLLINWKRYTRKKIFIRTTQIGISILLITLFIIDLFTPISLNLGGPGYKPFTYGFRERMRSKADIPAIRDWLKTLSKEDCTGRTIDLFSDPDSFKSYWPDSIEWPKSLKVFNPHYVNLELDENGHPKVRLTWGGVLGHWGVEIGMEDMKIPPSDFSRWGEYRLPVEPGVYVWHEIQ